MYVSLCWSANTYVSICWRTSLMSMSLLLLLCPACLIYLTRMGFEMGSKWPYNCCFVRCHFQDLFKTIQNTHTQTYIYICNHIFIYIYIYIYIHTHTQVQWKWWDDFSFIHFWLFSTSFDLWSFSGEKFVTKEVTKSELVT